MRHKKTLILILFQKGLKDEMKSMPMPEPTKKTMPKTIETEAVPETTPLASEQIEEIPKIKIPKEEPQKENIPEPFPEKSEVPSDLPEEDCVTFKEKKIQIKPTKLKYFRNKAASCYNLVKAIPLFEFLTYDKGVFDPNRSADELLFNFLVSAFDDSSFVTLNYDEFDAAMVDRIVKILGRLNGVDDKEAERKNREAQAAAKR